MSDVLDEAAAEYENGDELCGDCGANGPHFCQGVPGGFGDECETCDGSGEVGVDVAMFDPRGRGTVTDTKPCPTCERGSELRADDEAVAMNDPGWRDE